MLFFLQVKPTFILNTVISYDILIYFLSAFLIVSVVRTPDGIMNKVLKFKLFTWLGLLSYSIYMSHLFVIDMTARFFKIVLNHKDIKGPDGVFIPSLSEAETVIAFLISFLFTLILSQLIYIYLEKPMREKSRIFAFKNMHL